MIRKGLAFSFLFMVIMTGFSIYGWLELGPDSRIPVHWGLNGEVDRYAGRFEGLVMMPLLALFLSGLLAALPLIDPRGANLRKSEPAYLACWIGVLALLTGVQALIILTATGHIAASDPELGQRAIAGGIGALMLLIGNFLGKARPNWFMGIRTPWTLSSDLAWDKTHRLTGRLMVVVGALAIVGAFALPAAFGFVLAMAAAMGPALIGVVYSYFVWRSDPQRETHNAGDGD